MQMDCCVRPKRAKARSCVHVVEALKNSDAKGLFSAAFRKARDMEAGVATRLSCGSCGDREGWLHVCVACGFVGCFKKSGHEFSIQRHIRQHMSQNASHSFAVSTVTPSSVYCNECRDYVHNDTLEHLSRVERAAAVSVLLKSSVTTPFVMWTPVARDQKALSEQAAKLSAPAHFAGLRGLLNLGSTCFLNVIMQAGFVHNPIVRNYFLSDLHNSASCKAAACLMCQVDRFMAEMFSCEPQPFACHQFLFAMWQHSDYLAGYEQQDAHEFLISLFNGLHTSARTLDLPSRCSCVVHQSFGSTLRSECTCSSCGYVSTSVEPCLDISLEIPEELRQDGAPPCLLENCLAGFTHSEVLGDDDRLKCERCGSLQQARKQMSIESPPVVLCLQIKRFQRFRFFP
jgi:ubiquitin carboxyl-terminal hydrolase 22/27/51